MNNSALVAPEVLKKFPADGKRFQAVVNPHKMALIIDQEGNLLHLTRLARMALGYNKPEQQPDDCFFAHIDNHHLLPVMRDVAAMVCQGKQQATWMLRLRTATDRWRWFRAQAENQLETYAEVIAITLRTI